MPNPLHCNGHWMQGCFAGASQMGYVTGGGKSPHPHSHSRVNMSIHISAIRKKVGQLCPIDFMFHVWRECGWASERVTWQLPDPVNPPDPNRYL